MAPKVQVQPGFMPPGDDVMALVNEVGNSLKAILKNEQEVASLRKSESVATSDPQTVKTDGKKGSGEHVAEGSAQTLKAERSPAETSSSGGGVLPTKPSGMGKAEYSESSSSSASPSAMNKASPSASEGSPPSASGSPSAEGSASAGAPPGGDPSGAPPAGDPSAPAGGEAPAAAPSFQELVQMYSQLPPEDLQAHMAAIEQAAQAQGGGAGAPPAGPAAPGADMGAPPVGGPGPSAMPPPPPPPPSPSAGPGMPPPMGKSEAAGYMAELKKTQDQVGAIAEALTAVLTLPKRKSATGLSIIPMQKSEAPPASAKLSFEELKKNPSALHAELKKMTMPTSELKKSERDLVTDFYCRRISVEELAPLFQDKK